MILYSKGCSLDGSHELKMSEHDLTRITDIKKHPQVALESKLY